MCLKASIDDSISTTNRTSDNLKLNTAPGIESERMKDKIIKLIEQTNDERLLCLIYNILMRCM